MRVVGRHDRGGAGNDDRHCRRAGDIARPAGVRFGRRALPDGACPGVCTGVGLRPDARAHAERDVHDLQDAQDLIQENGVFFSRSADASGKGRNQVVDSNWIVVGQTPAVGALIGEGDAVLSVVKIGEPNPC
ncbi:hypothetical protein GS448_22570 [Rhodococcus hoagii]|nr:hypothetical protein [Prescottella equi]